MTFKEQLSDDVTLYCGDCREVIPTLDKIDAVVTDPPYGIEELVVGYGRTAVGKTHINIAGDKNLDCMVEVFELIKRFGNLWIAAFYSCRISPTFFQATASLDYHGEMVWDKKVLGFGRDIRYQHENVAFFKVGEPELLGSCASVLSYMRANGENLHPHEKPVQVMNNICSIVPGKIILDPFMGSGSTGVAAVQLKRGFIGVEFDQKYFDIARKRISEALKQPVAFWE